jgi:hypothetical protein
VRSPALIGSVLAVATLTLALIAGIYVGFALSDGRPRAVIVEVIVAAVFLGASWVTLFWSPLATAAALAAHGAWDVAHHLRAVSTRMPRWYVPFCSVFDWVFAAGLTVITLGRSAT